MLRLSRLVVALVTLLALWPALASAQTKAGVVTTLRVKDFPFPRSTIPALVRQLRFPGARENLVPVPGLTGVGDVRVSAASVRFYRSASR